MVTLEKKHKHKMVTPPPPLEKNILTCYPRGEQNSQHNMIMMIFGLCCDLHQVGQSKVKLYAPMDKVAQAHCLTTLVRFPNTIWKSV